MKVVRSYVEDEWYSAAGGFVELVDPSTEEPLARASTEGIDFGRARAHAVATGRPALARLDFAERGERLAAFSSALHAARDELIEISVANTGTTRRDAKFDVDGAIFTLAHYAELGKSLGTRRLLVDGEGLRLGRSARFWGQHVYFPLDGVALHINAFNFPAWGFAEKAACALLAGMPVITKPATSTALLTERCIELVLESGAVPQGALSLISGSTGDLLDHLGPQDVLAFTGSASTALRLRGKVNLLESSTRVNVEADSLNAAVLGDDVEEGSETWGLFVRDVVREVTQKTGQKCTAVRRVLVPRERLDRVEEALVSELAQIVVGNPRDESVRMGPLSTAQQLHDAISGVARLGEQARLVHGSGERIDGVGSPAGKGFFFGPTLLRTEQAAAAESVHSHEVFGPVTTLIGYDGTAPAAAEIVALAQGSLVTSLYSNDEDFLGAFLAAAGSTTGRVYIGSEKVAGQLPGSGVAMPQLLHGGPGRAGGGEELGGLRGLRLYLQRVALAGDKVIVERLAGEREARTG